MQNSPFFFSKSVFQGANRRREHFHLTARARSWPTQKYGLFCSVGRRLLVYVHSGVVHVTIFDFITGED